MDAKIVGLDIELLKLWAKKEYFVAARFPVDGESFLSGLTLLVVSLFFVMS